MLPFEAGPFIASAASVEDIKRGSGVKPVRL